MDRTGLMSTKRFGECRSIIPPSPKSGEGCGLQYPVSIAGVSDGHPLPVKDNEPIEPSIAPLLLTRRPPAIFRGIVSAVILSIQRHAIRPFSHVGKEGFKALVPLVPYANASPSIPLIVRTARVVAASTHIDPRLICWGSFHPVGANSLNLGRSHIGQASASAVLRATRLYVMPIYHALGAARALVEPFRAMQFFKYSPMSISHLMMIFHGRRKRNA
jgi:hypothetical protein